MSPGIFEDSKLSKRFYKYFLIGMLVRLALLPFFFQRDLLSTYQRAAETVFAGNMASDFQQILTNIIHSVYLFIIKSIIPAVSDFSPILLDSDSWTSWIGFVSSYNVFTVLALFKGLYLVFDLACMFLILRLSFDDDPEGRLNVFKFWMFNPVVIFVLYIFARHDIIGVFATIIALILAKKDRKYWSIIVLAVAIALRFFPIMILLPLIIYLARSRKDYIALSIIGVSGLAGVEVFSNIYYGKSLIFSLLNTQHFNYILSAKLDLIIHDRIFLFIVAYFLIIFSFIHARKKNFDLLLNYGAIIYLAYIALCYFHPQYVLWAVPFLVIIFVRRRQLVYYHWLQFGLLMIVLIYWGDLVTKFVFAPLDHRFFIYITGLIPIIERFYSSAKFVNIFRSIFSAVSLWMIYLIYRDNRRIIGKGPAGD
ncbi:MAG: hypothetical protein E3J58_06975 [Actinomycetota bacterium]|nr:MAG: hypothetical protein E3J58_06975 [Actinomycetota bacterium]